MLLLLAKKSRPGNNKNSRGQRFCLQQAAAKTPKQKSALLDDIAAPLTDGDIMCLISGQLSKCCSKGNCFLNHFTSTSISSDRSSKNIDYNAAIIFFRECRELTRTHSREERDLIMMREFRSTISMDSSIFTEGKRVSKFEHTSPSVRCGLIESRHYQIYLCDVCLL